MAFKVNGTDINDLFEPIGTTPKISNVGYKVSGTDISNFYADASLGTPYGTTNFNKTGVDIGQLFATYGSVGTRAKFLYVWGFGQATGTFTNISWNAISAGDNYSLAIKGDNTLWAWGANATGQLGDGTQILRSAPVQIGTSSWTQISAGGLSNQGHSLAIRSDGGLFVWGYNGSGQLGNNSTVTVYSPIQVGTSSWTSVSAGGNFSAAIRTDGALFTWGRNIYGGNLGLNDSVNRSSPTQVGTSSWTSVSAGRYHTAAIRADGGLFTWGSNQTGSLGFDTSNNYSWTMLSAGGSVISTGLRSDGLLFEWGSRPPLNFLSNESSPVLVGTSSWSMVSSGTSHRAAIRSDGLLFTWGNGYQGRLGDLTTVSKASPVQIGTSSWTMVSAGGTLTAAIRTDGALFIWGQNSLGQLGLNDIVNRSSPAQVGTDSWVQVSVGPGAISFGIDNNYRLFSWGYNGSGQLGLNNIVTRSSPVQIGTSSWTTVSAGDNHAGAIRIDGGLFTWGIGSSGRLGLATTASANTIDRSSPTQVGTSSWTQVKATFLNTAAIRSDGALFVWGVGSSGRLGLATTASANTVDRSSPTQVGTSSWSLISIGQAFALGQTSEFYAWGVNGSGQLGNSSTINRSSPVLIPFTPVINNVSSPVQVGSSSWTSVSAGFGTGAISNNNILFMWGLGTDGGLGTGDTINRSSPVQIGTSSWTAISLSKTNIPFTIATRNDGALFTWGSGSSGKLGLGTDTINRSSPVQIGTNSWSLISAGSEHSLALDNFYNIFSWGDNQEGQLGINSQFNTRSSPTAIYGELINRSIPTQLGMSSWTSVSAGRNYMLAIRSDNTLFSWGYNKYGALGINSTQNRSSPIQIGTSSWISITASIYSEVSGAIRQDGALFTWGRNQYGQLGLNDTINRSSPVQVDSNSWTLVSAGADHMLGVKLNGSLWTWGRDNRGQLGYQPFGLNPPRSNPLQVGLQSWTAISAGKEFSAGITTNSKLFTWGSNFYGKLGQNTTVASNSSPTQIGTDNWVFISLGTNHAGAIRNDNKLFIWGRNNYGQLGLNDTINRSSPVQVGTSSWVAVSAGHYNTGAIRNSYELYTWGFGLIGVLGNNTTISRSNPTLINRGWTNISIGFSSAAGIKNQPI